MQTPSSQASASLPASMRRNRRAVRRLFAVSLLLYPAVASATISVQSVSIDGRVDEAEWAEAQRFGDFRVTIPYTLALPPLRTEARLLSTPEGIAVAFTCEQPPGIPRLKPRLERDKSGSADRVSVMLDLDGDGKVAYVFAVRASGSIQDFIITDENQFNRDWNSEWTSAVQETAGGWSVELLIPWTVAAMRGSETPARTLKVYFDRLVASRNEIHATPAASPDRGRFVSDFAPIEIAQYRRSLFHVFPYVSPQQDFVNGHSGFKGGADLFWKPSAGFQLSATAKPDFGQVEADELVVNFDAIETFFSDKRPFFTENQGFFDLRLADEGLNYHQLLYSRRIGGPSDDGSGRAADIAAAVKLNGSAGTLAYGMLAAQEADATGRSFYAARLFRPFGNRLAVGWLGTHTRRPALDRIAAVPAIDLGWRPNARLMINAQALASFIEQAGVRTNGTGAWLRAFWTPAESWQVEAKATHFGRGLDFNDLGYQLRPSLNQLLWSGEYGHRVADDNSPLSNTRWRAETQLRANDAGRRLPGKLALIQTSDFRGGASLQLRTDLETGGVDDLIARGHGNWQRPARQRLFAELRLPVRGAWQFSGALDRFEEGLASHALKGKANVNWFPRDNVNLQFTLSTQHSNDWLVWEGDNAFGRYARRVHFAGLNANWFPGLRHELRLQAQWLGIAARAGERYTLEGGDMHAADATLPGFTINNFGLQLRYRYDLTRQADLYLVYSRGGILRQEGEPRSAFDLAGDAVGLRDSEHFLAKLRYRL